MPSEAMNHLADRIRMLVGGDPRLTEKSMFGGPTFLINGHILAGVRPDGGLLVSVGKAFHGEAAGRPGATEMRQGERLMSGFFWIDPDTLEDDDLLEDWIRFAERAVSQRPMKAEKPLVRKPKARSVRSPKTPEPR